MTWQPIETVPLDDTEHDALLFWDGGVYAVGYERALGPGWYVYGEAPGIEPTHWMSLPEPPEEE